MMKQSKFTLILFLVFVFFFGKTGADCVDEVISWVPDEYKPNFSKVIGDFSEDELRRIVDHRISEKMKEYFGKMKSVREMKAFMKDLTSSDDLCDTFLLEEHLVDSWCVITKEGLQFFRTDERFLATVAEYVSNDVTRKFKANGLTLVEEATIRHYTDDAYVALNEALEGTITLTPVLQEFADVLNKALNKLPNFNGKVYRGLGVRGAAEAKAWKVGDIIEYKSFKSTSTDYKEARAFTSLRGETILIIESKSEKFIDDVSINDGELEVLFQPGKTFTVQSFDVINNENEAALTTITIIEN